MSTPMSEDRLTQLANTAYGDVIELVAEVRRLREIGQHGCECSADDACAFARERDSLASKLAVAVEALRYVAESPEWGKDTALRRSISDLQDCARAALAAVAPTTETT